MTIKAQYNPSTALMHFTDPTKRVQVVDDGLFPPDDTLQGFVCECFAINGTPRYFTVIFDGVIACPGEDTSLINKTFKLEWVDTSGKCGWQFTDDSGFVIDLEFINDATIILIGHFYFTYVDSPGSSCDLICSTFDNQRTIAGCAFTGLGYSGTATIKPFWYDPWEQGVKYIPGFLSSHNGEFYNCRITHTSCTSGCPDPDEPGVGNDWETYWTVSTAECPE